MPCIPLITVDENRAHRGFQEQTSADTCAMSTLPQDTGDLS